jgi:hypothetical protein
MNRQVIEWLESPEGQTWSYRRHYKVWNLISLVDDESAGDETVENYEFVWTTIQARRSLYA